MGVAARVGEWVWEWRKGVEVGVGEREWGWGVGVRVGVGVAQWEWGWVRVRAGVGCRGRPELVGR